MRKFLVLLLVCFLTPILSADEDAKAPEPNTKASGRVEAAGTVLDEIQAAPDQRIPEEILGSAECVAVVPSLLNGGFVFGGRYGRGVASCRTPKGWSAPAFFTIGGGSFGLQIGGQASDVVMLIMNKGGMDNLLSSKFKLGGDASAAAGPVGRHAAADTDWKMRAQVLSYSRARGAFAGRGRAPGRGWRTPARRARGGLDEAFLPCNNRFLRARRWFHECPHALRQALGQSRCPFRK